MKCKQLTQDLQAVLDEKEELVTARDQYRHKFERLNQQMNYVLRGDQPTLVDIDGIIMQNKYLQERIKQAEEEKAVTASALAKCKAQYYAERFPPWGFVTNLTMPSEKDLCYITNFLALLEKKRTKGGMRSSIASGLAVSAKQEQLLQNNPFLDHSSKSSNVVEFRNLVMTLLE
ncbi:Coiled-coil domain-containing protein 149, partial [Stegodyphus mimosarum]